MPSHIDTLPHDNNNKNHHNVPIMSMSKPQPAPNLLKSYPTKPIGTQQHDEQRLKKPKKPFGSTFSPITHLFRSSPTTNVHTLSLSALEPKPISLARALGLIVICVTSFVVNVSQYSSGL